MGDHRNRADLGPLAQHGRLLLVTVIGTADGCPDPEDPNLCASRTGGRVGGRGVGGRRARSRTGGTGGIRYDPGRRPPARYDPGRRPPARYDPGRRPPARCYPGGRRLPPHGRCAGAVLSPTMAG
ncbi:hypothetical protein Ppa06_18450 [Planomonospora parontospora subsp. parontospora]|uniref:Uncharacterized protein n=1 Tax=Planomonospora parontospora subsp. parontospora TaxID=97194 RepID=A0ABQ4H7G7_9ACTN|nr:hypothetical protein Ppa06_18450 [Planomonospora parontospora subsp. parontospora]